MAELKTKRTNAGVADFLKSIADEERRRDCETLVRLMKKVTKAPAKMWGPSIVGFGAYHYKYASGREGDWFLAGFSPRKQDLTLYVMAGNASFPELLARLGKHKTGSSCLYVKRLSDVDLAVLEKLVAGSVRQVKRTYG
jgi:hypothetical protein